MATPAKRKRLDKVPTDEAATTASQKVVCSRCGLSYSRRKGYFPVSHSPMYRGVGYLPWCNDCIDTMYENYGMKLRDDKAALRRMCLKMDLYWNEKIYEVVERTAGTQSRIRSYISKSNVVKYVNKTYDDTLQEEADAIPDGECAVDPLIPKSEATIDQTMTDVKEPEEEVFIPPEYIDFWGVGYTLDYYDELQRRYDHWTNGTDIVSPTEQSLYRNICLLETLISRDAAAGRPIDKNVNSINTLLGSMNLKPTQQKNDAADAELDKMPLGVGIHDWENDRPLPPTPDELCDVNQNKRNVHTWFFGHTSKMVGLRNSYCKMYEDAMAKNRVDHPEYEEEDDDTLLSNIFGDPQTGGDA